MSDVYVPTPDPSDAGSDPTPDPTPQDAAVAAAMGIQNPVTPDPAPAASDDDDESIPGLDALPESWQAEFRKLRKENAARRVQSKEFEDTFSGFGEEQAAYVQQVIRAMASGNPANQKAAADELEHWAQQLKGTPADPEVDQKPADEPTGDSKPEPMDADKLLAQVAGMLEKRDQDAAVKAEAQRLIAEAQGLGYEVGSMEYIQLMTVAQQMGNDVQAAHARLEEATAAKVQAAIEAAQGAGARFPKQDAAKGKGVPTENDEQDWIGDITKTGEMARRFLESMNS